MIKFRFC